MSNLQSIDRIMILGASIYQVPLIRKAKELGLKTIVMSIAGNYPGIKEADVFYAINTTDQVKILEIAEKEKISAIVTAGTDVALQTLAFVADKLGLTGISVESSLLSTNKVLMKQAFKQAYVQTADFRIVQTLAETITATAELGFPCMIKCPDSSGSRGITKVKDVSEVEQAFHYAQSVARGDLIIVEEFIEGHEIGVDGYFGDQNNHFIYPHDKLTYSTAYTNIPLGHVFPYDVDRTVISEIEFQIIKALKALGLKNTFFNSDVLINEKGVYIIEIGARSGATCIPELISYHYELDYYEQIVRHSLGQTIALSNKHRNDACISNLLYSEKTGIITEIVNKTADLDFVIESQIDYSVGDPVNEFLSGNYRIGHIVVSGTDTESANLNLKSALEKIKIAVE
ncbi:MAG: ATP-grasp domain-containing protein [Clostridiaceae bacterium]|nr:ATP-grasp domain-containing protein [Clostridiaceae bacterium]